MLKSNFIWLLSWWFTYNFCFIYVCGSSKHISEAVRGLSNELLSSVSTQSFVSCGITTSILFTSEVLNYLASCYIDMRTDGNSLIRKIIGSLRVYSLTKYHIVSNWNPYRPSCPVRSAECSHNPPGRSEMTADDTGATTRRVVETATRQSLSWGVPPWRGRSRE